MGILTKVALEGTELIYILYDFGRLNRRRAMGNQGCVGWECVWVYVCATTSYKEGQGTARFATGSTDAPLVSGECSTAFLQSADEIGGIGDNWTNCKLEKTVRTQC